MDSSLCSFHVNCEEMVLSQDCGIRVSLPRQPSEAGRFTVRAAGAAAGDSRPLASCQLVPRAEPCTACRTRCWLK